MQDLGFDVLLKGSNMQRLLIGLWTSLPVSYTHLPSIIGVNKIVRATLSRNSIFAACERNYIRKYSKYYPDLEESRVKFKVR